MFGKKPYEPLLNILNKTTYQDLSNFPVGEYKRKPLESKYQYKSNTLAFVEDDTYDFVISMLLQSCMRKDSLILIDTENIFYKGTRRFFRDRNYPVHLLSYDQSKIESDTWSLWSQTSTAEDILVTSKEIIDAVYLYLGLSFNSERDYNILIYVFSSLLSYAVTTSMLFHNKFVAISSFLKENDFSSIDEVLSDLNDTTEYLWKEMEETEEEYLQAIEQSLAILELLQDPSNNNMVGQDSYEVLTPSLQKSATLLEYSDNSQHNAIISILVNVILTENLSYHESVKGRAQGINVVINKIENITDVGFMQSLIALSKKYKVNIFASCSNAELLKNNFPELFEQELASSFPFVLVQQDKKDVMDNIAELIPYLADSLYDFDIEEVLIADRKSIVIDRFDTTKHELYDLFVS